jgi:integrase
MYRRLQNILSFCLLLDSYFIHFADELIKWRKVSFHKALLDIFKELIEVKKEGKLLNYNNVENMNKAFLRFTTALGLKGKGYSMRTFRKTFITNASKNMDLATVSNLVGHQQINTTPRYYTKIDLARQKGQLDKLEEIKSAE